MQAEPYKFYAALQEGSRSSARVIVPIILELVRPKSVIDVGCGTGIWLSVFKEYGIEDFLGVDAAHVSQEVLEIPKERFVPFDLEQPFRADRTFDLVVSLEVAEHLSSEHADSFVEMLTRLGPVVLFSAAIPFQGGQNHVNEQWPGYWMDLFQRKGFVVIDCLRRSLWCNEEVESYYAQNILVYAAQAHLKKSSMLERAHGSSDASQLAVVHPKVYLTTIERIEKESRLRRRLVRSIKRSMPSKVQSTMRAAIMHIRARMSS